MKFLSVFVLSLVVLTLNVAAVGEDEGPVAEKGAFVTIKQGDGSELRAFVTGPSDANAAVLIVHDYLGITDATVGQFDAQLAALEHDGFVMRNRKGELCIASKLDLVSGTVQGHPDGFGFLVPDNGGDDLFIAPHEMRKVLHGDRVTAKRIGYDRRGRPEGEIVDVLARANREVVGRLHEERGIWFVEAENRKINQDLLIPPQDVNGASAGQVVVAEILEQPSEHREPIARIKHVLGSATDPGIEIEIALRKHDLPFEFSAAARRQAERLPPEVRDADRKGRLDLTALPLVSMSKRMRGQIVEFPDGVLVRSVELRCLRP